MATMNECECDVCVALAPWINDAQYVDLNHASIVNQLPEGVVAVLAAQGRLLAGTADDFDREVVNQAAKRCSAGTLSRTIGVP